MKKKLSIFVSLLACALLLAACGTNGSTTMDRGKDTDGIQGEIPSKTAETHDANRGDAKNPDNRANNGQNAVGDVVGGAGNAVNDAANGVGNAAKDVVDGAGNAVKDATNGVEKAVDDATGKRE